MPILNNKGFTIIELLIVIAILGILAIIGFSTFSGIQQSARDTKRKADVDAISKALEAKYNFASGKYLLQSGLADSDFTSGSVPKDNGQPYHFERSGDEKAFIVCATTLEKENQPYCKYSANGSAASIATLTVPAIDEEQPPAEEPPPPPPAPPAKKVFVTSSTYNSNLGGLDGADAKCQQAADTEAGLNGGTYKAWLSDDTGSPLTRFTPSVSGYKKVDETMVASSWEDFIDPTTPLLSGIDKTASGGNGSGVYVFSNTTAAGGIQNTNTNGHCNRWSFSGLYSYGSNLGLSGQTDSTWTYSVSGDCNTVWPRALYCFEQ